MSKAGDVLRTIRIFNPHNATTQALAAGVGNGIYLSRRASEAGRIYWSSAWQVVSVQGETDPKAFWQDYGCKTFIIGFRYTAGSALSAAQAFAAENYDITEWAKIPGLGRALFPATVAAWVKAQVKAQG